MLKNLKFNRGDYRYQNGERGLVQRLEVKYQRDNYVNRPRGIYVSLREMTIEETVPGMISESFMLFGSEGKPWKTALVMELKRESQKKLLAVVEAYDDLAPQLVDLYTAGRVDEAVAMILGVAGAIHA